jgi:hypothetical protein
MRLTTGDTLGPYEIAAPLGALPASGQAGGIGSC